MSDQDLDKLFRSKLEDIKKDPSPRAWDQISEALPQRKRGGFFFRIAATILLLMAAGSVMWYLGQDSPEPTLAVNTPVSRPVEIPAISEDSANTTSEQTEETVQREISKADVPSGQKTQASSNKPADTAPLLIEETDSPEKITKKEIVPDQTVEVSEPLIASTETPELNNAGTASSETTVTGQTLSFNIDDFESAEKTTAVMASAEPAAQDPDEEGLKKFWNVLKKVKEPEAGLGELRDLKNNLLAFGKEKNETD
ncbi:hypothetical protein [Fulvivirga sedimenti]|uniref:Uncharacterized protein n=1 Tax=Fulvivirga sedimenti TaxID=2879465 RepID=A0A9X1KUN1_9BACT|nr:hypothetical protein [Fulvivirga sedimenti]MCA6073683.1 hypothetical protein [Fulvivirga sedimenti]